MVSRRWSTPRSRRDASPDAVRGDRVRPDRVRSAATLAGTRTGGNFMADAARKRRAVWPDRATVRESYGGRAPLDVLAPEALDAYVRWGFVDRPDGQDRARVRARRRGDDLRGHFRSRRCPGSVRSPRVVERQSRRSPRHDVEPAARLVSSPSRASPGAGGRRRRQPLLPAGEHRARRGPCPGAPRVSLDAP